MSNRASIIALLLLAGTLLGGSYVALRESPAPTLVEETRRIEASLAIDSLMPARSFTLIEGATALDMLRLGAAAIEAPVVEREYAGFGTIVEAIGAFLNGTDDKYWTYTVNGLFAPVGAGAYVVKDGDFIEWKFSAYSGESL